MADGPTARILAGECIEVMRSFPDASVDAVVTDPPYEIGFNGASWDSEGIAFRQSLWSEIFRVAKPGSYLLSFSAARTYHRIATAIESGGYIVTDYIEWVYGSGMPHSRDITLDLDRRAGVERDVTGSVVGFDTSITRPGFSGAAHSKVAHARKTYEVSVPTSPEARKWSGWGTRLKPAHEPIALARRPTSDSVADNLISRGVGALNIDASLIGDDGGIRHGESRGRWPSNFLLGHSPDCEGGGAASSDLLCVDDCPVRLLAEQVAEAPRFFFIAKPRRRERVGGVVRNLHPTVKPLDLMRYLVRLVTPPGGVVLDPFLGSGTTGCAAMIEGFRFIGIERDPESYEIALARVSDYAFAHGVPRPQS